MNMSPPASKITLSADSGVRDLSPAILRVRGLRKAFGGNVVLDQLGLELQQGEVVLLRGENGSGKTTLLNILTGHVEPDAGVIDYLANGTARCYKFPRHWWDELNPFDHFNPESVACQGIGRTWQDIRLFKSQSLSDNIAVAHPRQPGENPFHVLAFSRRARSRDSEIKIAAFESLALLGLKGRQDSSADRISLGQSKRVAIARAVAAGARLLFLDEPLAGLDHQGIIDVLGLLVMLVRERGVTLVIVEHVFNQFHLNHLITTDWLLQDGKIVSRSMAQNLTAPTSSIVINSRVPNAVGISSKPDWIFALAGSQAEILEESLPRGAVLTRIRRRGVFQTPERIVLDMQDLVVHRGPRTVIGERHSEKDVGLSLYLYEGEIAVLHAPNGWGKTTLLMTLAGLINATRGTIKLDGRKLEKASTWERVRAGLRFVQSLEPLFPTLTESDVSRLAHPAKRPVGAKTNRRVGQLSGGQKQLLAITVTPPFGRANLYDEPFSGLDARTAGYVITEYICKQSGCTLLVVPLAA